MIQTYDEPEQEPGPDPPGRGQRSGPLGPGQARARRPSPPTTPRTRCRVLHRDRRAHRRAGAAAEGHPAHLLRPALPAHLHRVPLQGRDLGHRGRRSPSLHDVLICVGFLAFFSYEITLNVIAALLTLVGYSVNDTIVIFDRARENLRQRRKEPAGQDPERLGQPDPDPDLDLERHDVPLGPRPLPLRRRGAAVVRLHDGGRDPGRDLLDDLHREPPRGLVGGRVALGAAPAAKAAL